MRGAVLVILLLSGCITELLAPSDLHARSLACQAFDTETQVLVLHHGDTPDVEDAMAAWAAQVAQVLDEDPARFTWGEGIEPAEPLDGWLRDQPVLGDPLTLHVLWMELDEYTLEVVGPGAVAIDPHAARDPVARQALLFHGLGHVLGVVNQGVPLHDAQGPEREAPPGHTPGSAMAAVWHEEATYPQSPSPVYANETLADWRAAAQDERICP